MRAGLLLDIASVDARTHLVPESTPMISATEARTRVKGPRARSSSGGQTPGHTERYSPPGPNLHSGSIRLILYISILGTLNSIRFSNRGPIDAGPIGRPLEKTQTKTEQIPPHQPPFCARPPTRTDARIYMGPAAQKVSR